MLFQARQLISKNKFWRQPTFDVLGDDLMDPLLSTIVSTVDKIDFGLIFIMSSLYYEYFHQNFFKISKIVFVLFPYSPTRELQNYFSHPYEKYECVLNIWLDAVAELIKVRIFI